MRVYYRRDARGVGDGPPLLNEFRKPTEVRHAARHLKLAVARHRELVGQLEGRGADDPSMSEGVQALLQDARQEGVQICEQRAQTMEGHTRSGKVPHSEAHSFTKAVRLHFDDSAARASQGSECPVGVLHHSQGPSKKGIPLAASQTEAEIQRHG